MNDAAPNDLYSWVNSLSLIPIYDVSEFAFPKISYFCEVAELAC